MIKKEALKDIVELQTLGGLLLDIELRNGEDHEILELFEDENEVVEVHDEESEEELRALAGGEENIVDQAENVIEIFSHDNDNDQNKIDILLQFKCDKCDEPFFDRCMNCFASLCEACGSSHVCTKTDS